MEVIKHLVKSMYMELKAADCYHMKALKYKDDNPQVATAYNEIALQELQHCEKFHSVALLLIAKIKSSDSKIPEAMQAIWDYEHTNIMEEYEELKYKINKFTV